MATIVLELDELSPDAKELWDNINSYKKLFKGVSLLPSVNIVSENTEEVLLTFLRTEIRRMIRNSETVIEQCDEIIRKLTKYGTQREYLTCDARIAKTLHTRLIERLNRILKYKEAFDYDIVVDDEKPNALYVDTTKRPSDNIEATFEIDEETDSNLELSG